MGLFFWTIFVPGVEALIYLMRNKEPVVDELVLEMVDVRAEPGELEAMLYRAAANYDDDVALLTESLTGLLDSLLIIVSWRCRGLQCRSPFDAAYRTYQ